MEMTCVCTYMYVHRTHRCRCARHVYLTVHSGPWVLTVTCLQMNVCANTQSQTVKWNRKGDCMAWLQHWEMQQQVQCTQITDDTHIQIHTIVQCVHQHFLFSWDPPSAYGRLKSDGLRHCLPFSPRTSPTAHVVKRSLACTWYHFDNP